MLEEQDIFLSSYLRQRDACILVEAKHFFQMNGNDALATHLTVRSVTVLKHVVRAVHAL